MFLEFMGLLSQTILNTNARAKLVLLWLLAISCCAAQPRPACLVQLPVYDARGNRLNFQIIDAKMDQENAIDLLQTREQPYHGAVEGATLYFPKNLLASHVRVMLRDPKGDIIK